jgi:hypothetical protein
MAMNIRKLVVSLLVASFLAVPMMAQACTFYGSVYRLWEYSSVSYVYLKPYNASTSTATYFFQIVSPELRDAARTALTSGKNVAINDGTTDACVANANNGIAAYIIVNP